jgi:hydrogenase nickel incorporation protein HypA/HybF
MHELAITESVIEAISDRFGSARIVRVQLEIGKLSGVMPDAVRFCFGLSAEGTALANAVLEIVETPGRAQCVACGAIADFDDPIALCRCGSANLEFFSGRELKIREVEMAKEMA